MCRYYEDRDIDSLPEDDLPKTKGWVARNKDESLVFCYHKPHRENSITQEWWGSCDADFRIYDDTIDEQFKDLKWEDEPREVELFIKPIDEPKELEEAANEWILSHNDGDVLYVKNAFKDGAKWMANQMLERGRNGDNLPRYYGD